MAGECGWGIPMPPEAAFDAISNSRRRRVLLSVDRAEEGVDANELSVEIAARENEVDPSALRRQQRTRVYISLIQNHLEKLDEHGAVDYDERSKVVKATDATTPLARWIREITTDCYTPAEEASE